MKFAEELVEKEAEAQVAAIRIDCSNSKSVTEAFEGVHSLGCVEVLVYNTNTPFPSPLSKFTNITAEAFQLSLTTPAMGAFYCVQQVLPGMLERKKGTIVFTGATASIRGGAGFSELACGKFALRALSQCLAREFHPQGVHVAHVIIDGIISTQRDKDDGKTLNANAIAEIYWQLHNQDKSAWTQELDLRPCCEKF
ncbi:hypothetical protein O6H91_01G113900 [Diphasiastrum complanatum]|nr:hypothetical protein O6H91_01G113900 [Diphasiastrum complanatum]